MSAYLITRTTVRFLAGMALCTAILFGPGFLATAIFGGVL